MRSQRFEDPRLFVVRAEALPLSGPALLELMRAVLARGLPFRFCARGFSMAPFIRDGDVITVAPLKQRRPRLGEVVAFVRPEAGTLVVHRVVARRPGGVLIRGDGVPGHTDGIVSPESILGRVTRVERDGQEVFLGLGVERRAIAWLSRTRRLVPWGDWLASRLRSIRRR